MAAERLDAIRDLLYRIEAAMDDVDADLASDDSPDGTRQALWHLYRACAEVRTISLEPLAVGRDADHPHRQPHIPPTFHHSDVIGADPQGGGDQRSEDAWGRPMARPASASGGGPERASSRRQIPARANSASRGLADFAPADRERWGPSPSLRPRHPWM